MSGQKHPIFVHFAMWRILAMLKMAVRNTKKLIREKSKEENIRLGRFFTKADTARLMANMCSLPTTSVVRVLDPGAGTGILSAALVERLCQSETVKEIDLVCYENNATYLPMLEYNLQRLRKRCRKLYGVKLVVNVLEENYVLSGKAAYAIHIFREEADQFDYIIMNPPAELMPATSPEALCVTDLFKGGVDLTYLFLAMANNALAKGGELVALLPTVFSTSPQLAKLRCHLFSENTLKHLHMFCANKPKKPLKKHMVMHICHTQPQATDTVGITVSLDDGSPEGTTLLPSQTQAVMLRGEDKSMLLFRDATEIKVMQYMQSLTCSFATFGLRMKTGYYRSA